MLQSLDLCFRSSIRWRAIGVALCAWIAGVIGFAGWAAYEDGLELYRWTILVLLLVGAPIAVAAIIYAAVLLGRKGTLLLIALFGIAAGTRFAYETHQSDKRAKAEEVREARRVAARRAQERKDWEQFGAECTESCNRLSDHAFSCAADCSRRRGAEMREASYVACMAECRSDPHPYCQTMCQVANEEGW